MENELLDSDLIESWAKLPPSKKGQLVSDLFTDEWQELEITQLAKLCTFASLEGHTIPNNTQAMLSVLACFEQAGGVETRESEYQKLEVRKKQ
jgi:hypothetical protein